MLRAWSESHKLNVPGFKSKQFLSILVLFIKWNAGIDYNSQFNQIDP